MDGGAYHYFVEDTACSVGHFVEFIDAAYTTVTQYEGTTIHFTCIIRQSSRLGVYAPFENQLLRIRVSRDIRSETDS